jgi:hypothetical protein
MTAGNITLKDFLQRYTAISSKFIDHFYLLSFKRL